MTDLYRDRWITCDDEGITMRWYYLWGARRVPYSAIKAARRVHLSLLRGKGRIWGSATIRYWASLDPGRPAKDTGFVLDLGGFVRPFVTPDEPEAFEQVLSQRTGLTIPDTGLAPII
jgi:hypothetical protein